MNEVMWDKILNHRRVKGAIPLFILFGFHLCTRTYTYFYYSGNEWKHFVSYLMLAISDLVILFIPILFFRNNIKRYYYLLLLWIPVMFVNGLVRVIYGTDINYFLINAVLTTNSSELIEFFSMIPWWVYMLNVFFVIAYISSVYYSPGQYYIEKRTSVAVILATVGVLFVAGLVKGYRFQTTFQKVKDQSVFYQFGSAMWNLWTRNYRNVLVGKSPYGSYLENTSESDSRKVVLLVIGESSRKQYWEHYNSSVATNPNLTNSTNLIWLENAMSPGNFTDVVNPMLLTPVIPSNLDEHIRYYGMNQSYKECGYTTVFLSNQEDQFLNDGNLYSHLAEFDTVINIRTRSIMNTYDGQLIPEVEKVLNGITTNVFLVVHTMGSHFEYKKRYPLNDRSYLPLISNANSRKEHYINSIHYTDYVLHELINQVKRRDEKALVWYISDHGETMPEDVGMAPYCHVRAHKSIIEIPSFIGFSESFAEGCPEKIEQAKLHALQPFNSAYLSHSLLDLSGIQWNQQNLIYSIAQPEFEDHPDWILNENKEVVRFESLP